MATILSHEVEVGLSLHFKAPSTGLIKQHMTMGITGPTLSLPSPLEVAQATEFFAQ
jgi:hypothetical protein